MSVHVRASRIAAAAAVLCIIVTMAGFAQAPAGQSRIIRARPTENRMKAVNQTR